MGPQHIFTINVNNTEIDVILFTHTDHLFYAQAHTHTAHEFHYIRDGKATLHLGTEPYTLEGGKCYLITKGSFHRIEMQTDYISRIGALISPHASDNTTSYFDITDKIEPYTEFIVEGRMKKLLDILIEYLDEERDSIVATDYINAIFTSIIIELVSKLSPDAKSHKKSKNTDEFLPHLSDESKKDRILAYFCSNLATATLEDLSNVLHLSRRQVARFLRDKMNDSFSGLIKKYRIEHAKSLIISNKNSLEEVAFLSGYNSYKGFYLAFQSYTGMNPQAFKEEVLSRQK